MAKRRTAGSSASSAASYSNTDETENSSTAEYDDDTTDQDAWMKRRRYTTSTAVVIGLHGCVAVLLGLVAARSGTTTTMYQQVLQVLQCNPLLLLRGYNCSTTNRIQQQSQHYDAVLALDLQGIVRIHNDSTSERGLVLDRAVSVGDVLLDIPYHHTICVERLTQAYPTLRGIVQELSQRVVTADATVSTPI